MYLVCVCVCKVVCQKAILEFCKHLSFFVCLMTSAYNNAVFVVPLLATIEPCTGEDFTILCDHFSSPRSGNSENVTKCRPIQSAYVE